MTFALICALFAWTAPLAAGMPSTTAWREPVTCSRYTGLFIGIGDYAHLPDRTDAPASARALYDLFQSVPGGERNVLLLDDQAQYSAVNRALMSLRSLERDECAVLYFAGHAFTMDTDLDAQVGFLLLADSRTPQSPPKDTPSNDSSPEGSLSMRYLRQLFESSRTGGVLLLVDSGIGGLQGDALRPSSVDTTAARSRLVLAAGGRDEQVDAESGISPFAEALIAGLSGRTTDAASSAITASELAAFVESSAAASDNLEYYPNFRTLLEDGADMLLPTLPSREEGVFEPGDRRALERPRAHVSVRASPESATILIDGVAMGRGSISTDVPSGEATIEAVAEGHATWRLRVHLRPGEMRTFNAAPKLQEAYVRIVNLPPGTVLRLDGEEISAAEIVHRVPPGARRLEVRSPSRRMMSVDLSMQAGELRIVSYQDGLFSPGVLLRSMMVPGWGQLHAGAYLEAALAAVVVGGLAGFGAVAERRYDAREEAYRSALVSYRHAETAPAVEKAKGELVATYGDARDAHQLRRIVWSAFAAVYGANLLDVLIHHGRIPQLVVTRGSSRITMLPRIEASSEGMAFGVDVRF